MIFGNKKTEIWLVAGLGNPGAEYEKTRHNAGFMAADKLAIKHGVLLNKHKFDSVYGEFKPEGKRVFILKPQTYMNLSGESIAEILNYYKADASQDFLVVFDDISLAPGNIRIRKKGSAGGHNGIKNIIAMTGTENFMRIKVGVGEKPKGWDLADYVLGRFSDEDRRKVDAAIEDAIGAVVLMIHGEADQAMNRYNAKKEA